MSTSSMRSLCSRAVACVILGMSVGGCELLVRGTPWSAGGGVKVSPALISGESEDGWTVHPTVSFGRVDDLNWVQGGAQIRQPFTLGERSAWAGLEALVGYTDVTGVAANALIGLPIAPSSSWRPSLFGSIGLSRYYGGTDLVLSAGVDLQPEFFRNW